MNRTEKAQHIADQLRAAEDFQGTLTALAQELDDVLHYDALTLVTFSPDGSTMGVRWRASTTEAAWEADQVTRSTVGTPAEWVRASGQALVESDTLTSRFGHHPPREAGRRSFVLAPLGDSTIGVIGWTLVEPNGYEPADAEAVAPIAAAIGERIRQGALD